MSNSRWAATLVFAILGAQARPQLGIQTGGRTGGASGDEAVARAESPQSIPDAPTPQAAIPNAAAITPGKGVPSTSAAPDAPAPAAVAAPAQAASAEDDREAPTPNQSGEAFRLVVTANFVDVPFTVKDSKGALVAGLTSRDVRVYENGVLQHISNFTVDPFPMSVAIVLDQSMTHDEMTRVNNSLAALQGAFAPYDELAFFTYNNGPREVTKFTASQSARFTQAVETSKADGRDALLPGELSGPISQTTVINNQNFDPNTSANRGHSGLSSNIPRDVHTLNDAILAAATELSKTERGRRRIIYVISDGKEYGSEAKTRDVIRYLQGHKIAVYGTLVGDSAVMGIGFLDRIHLPLMMRDNILPVYATATGGNLDAEFRQGGIEKSFAKLAAEARNQYTLGYYTHEPFIDGKYRKVEVRVLRPNLTVLAKEGYFPSAMDAAPPVTQRVAQ